MCEIQTPTNMFVVMCLSVSCFLSQSKNMVAILPVGTVHVHGGELCHVTCPPLPVLQSNYKAGTMMDSVTQINSVWVCTLSRASSCSTVVGFVWIGEKNQTLFMYCKNNSFVCVGSRVRADFVPVDTCLLVWLLLGSLPRSLEYLS